MKGIFIMSDNKLIRYNKLAFAALKQDKFDGFSA